MPRVRYVQPVGAPYRVVLRQVLIGRREATLPVKVYPPQHAPTFCRCHSAAANNPLARDGTLMVGRR